ncbi:hypothetical protein ACFWVF_06455 [Streptomyces sp. NPDC058659]|uniref:hypothetical protein n=1 Tax=unclassified Streptomyces TaxID=2593676 RepID=UPI00365BF64C
MAEVTNAELQQQINNLHQRLISGEVPIKVTYAKDPMDQRKEVKDPDGTKKEKEETFSISEFKAALIKEQPRVVTDNMLPFDFVKRFADMFEELQKEPWTEYFEAMGLDGFAAAFEKNQEKNEDWKSWLFSAFTGLFIPLVGAMIALMFLTNFKIIQRLAQKAIFNGLFRWIPSFRDKIFAMDADNRAPKFQRTEDVKKREQQAGGGLASLPETANFDGLRRQLEGLIPQLEKFNAHAPAFNREFRKLPSEGKATKAGNGVKAVADAITGVNHESMPLIATGMGKISDAVKTSDPKKTTAFANAIGKLKTSMQGLDVDKVPKMATFQSAANAARDLAQHTGTLSGRMNAFAAAVRELNGEMGGGGAAPSTP